MSFKKSVEYDLSHSEFGVSLHERFLIEDEIYHSSLSHIYKIKSKDSNKKFVLKAIKKQEAFEFNIEIANKIHHKNIVKILEYGHSEEFLYIIREYIEGVNLEKYVEDRGPLTSDEARLILDALSEALNYLHNFEEGAIIFRDLKPSNIMVKDNGSPVLIDIITIRALKEEKTTDTFYIGSKGYTAPEQYGYMQSSKKSDVFSLGATLFYMFSGRHPELLNKEIINALSVNNSIKRVLLKSTQFNPEKRHKDIDNFMTDINRPFNTKKVSFAIVIVILIMMSYFAYQDRSVSFDEEMIESSDDIAIEELILLDQGVNFKFDGDEMMTIEIDRLLLDESIRDFEFITINTADQPFVKDKIQDEIYKGVKDNIGFSAYPEIGYSFEINDKIHLYLAIYSEDQEPLAYYVYNDIDNPYLLVQGELEVDRISDTVTFHHYNDHGLVKVDTENEVAFTKISVWSNPGGFSEDSKNWVRNEVVTTDVAHDYIDPGLVTGYGADGIRDRLSWMILLIDKNNEIVKEYYFTDDFISDQSQKDIEGVYQLEDDIVINYYKDYAVVEIDPEKVPEFTHISFWGSGSGFNEENQEATRNDVKKGDGVRLFNPAGYDTGYGTIGTFKGQDWMLFLLDEDNNIIKEYVIRF